MSGVQGDDSEGMGIDWPDNEPPDGKIDIVLGIRTPEGDVLTCVLGAADPTLLGDGDMEKAIKSLCRLANGDVA